MDFGLSPEQRMLRDAVDRLLREHSPLDHVREVVARGDNVSAAVVAALAELGLPGIVVPEEHGGLGLGLLDAVVVAEALGAAVAPVPFVARSVLAPLALRLAGSPEQQAQWLPRIAEGSARFGVGLTELVNRRDGSGMTADNGTLRGTALFVLDSADADAFIVADEDGSLHLVTGDADRLEFVALPTVEI
jgi:alkylation response protein AidB-like acyl-CoA dehydrogenase